MYVQNKKGSALPMVMIIAGLVAVFSYVIFGMLQSRRSSTEDELRALQAKMLAADIVELGKYLFLYERVIYLTDPLTISAAREATRKDFLNQSYGSLAPANSFMINACGGYDATAKEIGNFMANGSQVFCPLYLRNPLLDGSMFEDMLLEMWSRGNRTVSQNTHILRMSANGFVSVPTTRKAVLERDAAGAYTFSIDLENAIQSSNDQFIRLHLNQNIIQMMRQNSFKAKLTYTIFGNSTGFTTLSNERFITVEADVSYGNALSQRSVNVVEPLIMYSSTVKDFAIFIMYPTTSAGNPTTKFSESVILGGASTKVNGRVFFNGDIDTPLANLPTFNEVVVISGKINVSGLSTEQARTLMAEKFKKGVVTGFPVKRLINDGECLPGLPTANLSGMYCKNPQNLAVNFGIGDYIKNLGNICSNLPVKYTNGVYRYDLTNNKDPIRKEQCTGSAPEKIFLSGGSDSVTVTGSYAFIVSPIKSLIAGADANIYGTIFGGYIRAGSGSRFYSLGTLRKGLPGIASDIALNEITSESERILTGVGVPLLNLPLVKDAAIGK